MREVLEEAERKAKADKQQKRRRDNEEVARVEEPPTSESSLSNDFRQKSFETEASSIEEIQQSTNQSQSGISESGSSKDDNIEETSVRVPVSKDVTIG